MDHAAGPDEEDDADVRRLGEDSAVENGHERRVAGAAVRGVGDAHGLMLVGGDGVPADVDPAAEGAVGPVVHHHRVLVVEVAGGGAVNGHGRVPGRAAVAGGGDVDAVGAAGLVEEDRRVVGAA